MRAKLIVLAGLLLFLAGAAGLVYALLGNTAEFHRLTARLRAQIDSISGSSAAKPAAPETAKPQSKPNSTNSPLQAAAAQLSEALQSGASAGSIGPASAPIAWATSNAGIELIDLRTGRWFQYDLPGLSAHALRNIDGAPFKDLVVEARRKLPSGDESVRRVVFTGGGEALERPLDFQASARHGNRCEETRLTYAENRLVARLAHYAGPCGEKSLKWVGKPDIYRRSAPDAPWACETCK